MTIVIIVVVAILVIAVLYYIGKRNGIIASRNRVDESWSGIDVQLKRRHDLVPNLVETVKGYTEHESATLAAVVQARSAAMSAGAGSERAAAEERLGSALEGVRVVAEQYPELRAAQNYEQLMLQLSELEDQIQAARRIFNAYNTSIQVFPNSLVAGGKFTPRELFQLDSPAERAVPVVAF